MFSVRKIQVELEDLSLRITDLCAEVNEAMQPFALALTGDASKPLLGIKFKGIVFCPGCMQQSILALRETIQILEKILELPTEKESG